MQLLDPRTGEPVSRSPAAGFGRIPSSNESRLEKYPLGRARKRASTSPWLTPGSPLHQGGWPHCVPTAGNGLLASHPAPKFQLNALDIYNWCQKIDYWPGEDYDGTSVDALLQVYRQLGIVLEYQWTRNVEVLAAHVHGTGPAILGTTWYEHMSNPTPDNRIAPTGAKQGGHAYLLPHVKPKQEDFTILNSWGGGWARKGRAEISFAHMQQLLDDQGEAAIVMRWAA